MKYQITSLCQSMQATFLSLANRGGTAGLALLVTCGLLVGCQNSTDLLSPEEHFEQALTAIEQSDNPAIALHLVALQEVPGFESHVHLLTGALGSQVGSNAAEQLDMAMNELMLACQHDDTRVPALVLIGKKLRDIRELNSAISQLNQALQINPNYVPAHKWLAAIYYDLGAMQNAHDHLQKISELNPYNAPSQFTMGIINQDYRRFDLAEKNFEECLRRLDLLARTPSKLHLPRVNRQEVLIRLGQARIELREYEKAVQGLNLALESRAVLCLQATCFRSLDRVDEARDHLDRGIKQFVDNPERTIDENAVYQEARRLKGTMLIEAKQFAEARTVLDTLCTEYPSDHKSLYKLVQALRGLGLEKEATAKLKVYEPLRAKRERFSALHIEAIAEPNNADTRYELGSLALELGEFRLGVDWFKAALFIDPEHEKAIQAMNKLYGVLGDQDPNAPGGAIAPKTNEPTTTDPATKDPESKDPAATDPAAKDSAAKDSAAK